MSKRRRLALEAPPPTIIVDVGEKPYLLDQVQAVVNPLDGEDRFIPTTCLDASQGVAGFDLDDVWSDKFLKAILVKDSHGTPPNIGQDIVCEIPQNITLSAGPYMLQSSTGRVFSVLRLFEDTNNTFVGGTVPDGPSRFRWLQASSHIPVPSKLYDSEPSEEQPLTGLRFGVKDAIDIAGLETGNGSKCYRESFPPRDSTAPCIGALIAAGAVMVGKLRCCQWCDGQDPLQRLEEVTPTNPRGDSFQKPSASSSGSAASCASYSWLDFTIGTDTGGSVRHPAGVNGLYGIRPSLDAMKSAGLVCTSLMDTPGVFARSAKVAESVAKVMMGMPAGAVARPPKRPRYKLLYAVEQDSTEPSETPKFFSRGFQGPEAGTPAGKLMEDFVKGLENFLEAKREEVCIFDLWKETHPETEPEDLLQATGSIYKNIVYGQLSRDVVQPFAQQYQQRHGRPPFIEEITQARLDYGASVSDSDLEQSIETLHAFAGWVNKVLLPAPGVESEEIPLLVYPQSWGRPQYRDELGRLESKEVFWNGFSVYSLSYSSGCPDYTIPVGEVSFTSKFTKREEHLPVALSLLAPRNMDTDLLELLTNLEERGLLKPVSCGSRLYEDS
ncbi:uncharacterized protein JN550_011165 [Neoarthrinium moseri]|uniref:uncharacterized protein n=1 Tax=Neoarthrinium moseri TaxID=1658444 RepID=UPI001FDB820D|nr:uncharacterized protein JN550_011165 [Neoarthrinium moseri]KAI1860850.1 hypothetical protein JN550_011165 [Neoarthrinium moseri]